MPSVKEQRDKILKLSAKDKKLARLFNYADISDRDVIFLNYVYEEKQSLQFRYGVIYSAVAALLARTLLFK